MRSHYFIGIILMAVICLFSMDINAQESFGYNNSNLTANSLEKEQIFHKHEIGFSVGVFPTIGAFVSPDEFVLPVGDDPIFSHTEHIERADGMYKNMYHFGSYTVNYHYHINPKHSLGASFSWVGKHIDKYWIYEKIQLMAVAGNTSLLCKGITAKLFIVRKMDFLYIGEFIPE
jgi:hypothetical protein